MRDMFAARSLEGFVPDYCCGRCECPEDSLLDPEGRPVGWCFEHFREEVIYREGIDIADVHGPTFAELRRWYAGDAAADEVTEIAVMQVPYDYLVPPNPPPGMRRVFVGP